MTLLGLEWNCRILLLWWQMALPGSRNRLYKAYERFLRGLLRLNSVQAGAMAIGRYVACVRLPLCNGLHSVNVKPASDSTPAAESSYGGGGLGSGGRSGGGPRGRTGR